MSIADKLTTVAENVPKVYEQGRKDERSDFWDIFQNYGNRTQYKGAFTEFTKEIFKPKYDIIFPNSSVRTEVDCLFQGCKIEGSYTQLLKDLGITIDFSKTTYIQEVFSNTRFTEVILYAPKATQGYGTFGWNYALVDLNLTVSDNFNWNNNATFSSCPALKNLTLGNKITKSGFSVSSCTKLSKKSIENIINALSEETSGLTVTLSKTAVNKAFETSEGANDGSTSEEWSALEATKTNWTISLA